MEHDPNLSIAKAPTQDLMEQVRNSRLGMYVTAAVSSLAITAGVGEMAISPEPVVAEGNVPVRSAEAFEAGSAVVPWAVEQHPYQGSVTFASDDLQQQCAADIFTPPKVLRANMHLPGKEYQDVLIQIGYGAVNTACDGQFKRLSAVKPQLVRHGKVINMDPTWDDLLRDGNTNLASHPGIEWFNSHHNPKLYYEKGDKVRFKLRLQELNVAAKKVVKTVITTHPVAVKSG